MRRLLLILALGAAAPAAAYQCPVDLGIVAPAEGLAPAGPLLARSAIPLELERLLKGKPRFVDAAGRAVPATIQQATRQHAWLVPATPLPVGAVVSLASDDAPAWLTDRRFTVAPAAKAPIWKEDPAIVRATDEDEGPFGVRWARVVRVAAPGAGVVRVTLTRDDEKPVEAFLPVVDDRVTITASGCGTTFPPRQPPGDYTLTITLLDGSGQPGESRSLPFVLPERGPR
ncbi:MAG: hypothetical protein KC549_04265 [Myxococcales bacterium]|nr:hypothetical protein [Myxococcales bacterium]